MYSTDVNKQIEAAYQRNEESVKYVCRVCVCRGFILVFGFSRISNGRQRYNVQLNTMMQVSLHVKKALKCAQKDREKEKNERSEQGSNLRGNIPLDFESNALTTRPSLPCINSAWDITIALLHSFSSVVEHRQRNTESYFETRDT